MSIQSASVNVDGTVATTGGTATSFLTKNVGNPLEMILDDSSEFVSQTRIEFSTKDPKVSTGAPNGYTQARSKVKLYVPLLLDNGEYTINTVTIEFAVDHETTVSEINSMRVLAAQFIHDSDYDEFWQNQALS